MEHLIEEVDTNTLKKYALTQKAVNLFIQQPDWSNERIAEELGISRTTLWNLAKGHDAQQLMQRELHEMETELNHWIQELHESNSPTSQREAAKLKLALAAKLADKLRPTKTEAINLNIDINLNELQTYKQLHQEALSRLPPHMRETYSNNIKQIKQEWNQQPQP